MSTMTSKIPVLVSPGIAMGSAIFGINLYNMKRSPIYLMNDAINNGKIFAGCIAKGCIYGAFYPFALVGISLSIFETGDTFENHFVPFSKYGHKLNNLEKGL